MQRENVRFDLTSERTDSYLHTLRTYIVRHGLPMSLYSDRHMGIDGIQASCPQAKGRVERANQTLQDRLVKAMRLEGINDMHTANAWIEPYIDAHVPWRDGMDTLNVLLGHYRTALAVKDPVVSVPQADRAGPCTRPTAPPGRTNRADHRAAGRDLDRQQTLDYSAIEKKDTIQPVLDAKALAARAWNLPQTG